MSHLKKLLWLGSFLFLATMVHGQTGPVGPMTGAGPVGTTGGGQGLSANAISNYFQGKGGNPKVSTGQNGAVDIVTNITKDNWRFVVDVMITPDGKRFHLLCPLGVNATTLNQQRLLALLKWHFEHPDYVAHFSYRDSDKQLCFEEPNFPMTMDMAGFERTLNQFLADIRETYPLWGQQATTGARGGSLAVESEEVTVERR